MLLILFFLIIIIMLITLKIRINLKEIDISNLNKDKKIRNSFAINLEIIVFRFIKILSIKFNDEKIKNMAKKIDYKKIDISKEWKNRDKLKRVAKSLKINLKKLDFKLEIGIYDMILTIWTTTLISIIIPILLRNNANNLKYRIEPIYNKGNVINLKGKGIIEIYLVHIIYALYILKKKGRNKDVRRVKPKSSNRRAYDYSNG